MIFVTATLYETSKKNQKKIPMKHNKYFAKDFKLEKLKNS